MRSGGRRWRHCTGLILSVAATLAPAWSATAPAAENSGGSAQILERLVDRVRTAPGDASAWRMLGHVALEHQQLNDAEAFLKHAVRLDELNAAAWFDLARTHQARHQSSAAIEAYSRVLDLAPDSEYATDALEALQTLSQSTQVELVDFEVREFNGLEHIDEAPATEVLADATGPQRLRLRIETGVLFDSNVALSPLSRNLAPGNTDSAQIFVAPDFEYRLWDVSDWRSGPRAAGNFTWNEPDFSNFDLQSYRPGWFLERDFFGETLVSSLRIEYEFAHDEFAEVTFGNRHAVVTSGTLFWDDVRATSLYWASNYTDFANDGPDPPVTSQDGWSNALGMFQEWGFTSPWISVLRLGGQLERVDTTGSDNLYNGFGLNAEVVVPIAQRTDGTLNGSWGIRDYPEFQSGLARDETIWSASAQIRHQLKDSFSLRGVVAIDRFVSDNPLYDAQRVLAGMVLIYQR